MASKFGGVAVEHTGSRFGGVPVDRPQEAQPADQGGVFQDFGAGVRRGVEQVTGGFGQRGFEALTAFNQSQLTTLAEGINSGQIQPTEENLARFDQLSILARRGQETLAGAEKREVQRRGEFAPIQERSPIAATAGQITGQVLPTLAIPGAQAATLPGRVAVGVTTGGAIGAAQPTVGDESVGRNVAVGAATGGLLPVALEKAVAPAAKAAISKFSDIRTTKLLEEAAPSIDKLKGAARVLYDKIDESGGRVVEKKVTGLMGDIISTLKKSGADIDVTPKASGLIRRLESEKGQELTVSQIDTLRQVASSVAGELNKKEARLGVMAIDKIDQFLDDLAPSQITGGSKAVGKDFREARKFWGRAKRAEEIELAFKLAEGQATGFENGIRIQFRQMLARIDKGKLRGFSPEEVKLMRQVEQGTTVANIAKVLGKFGLTTEKSAAALLPTGGAGAGFVAGGGPGLVAVLGVGTVSKALSKKLTEGSGRFTEAVIKAGPNAKQITRAYLSNVPKSQRSVEDLTELLMRPNVDLGTIKQTGNKLVDDAVFFAENLAQRPAIVVAEEQ